MTQKKTPYGKLKTARLEIKYYGPFGVQVNEALRKYLPTSFLFDYPSNSSIFLNGKPVQLNEQIKSPVFIEVFLGETEPAEGKPTIIWENDEIAVVFKPSQLATQPTRFLAEPSLKLFLSSMISDSCHIPSRLDYGVSGLILISKVPKRHKFVHDLYAKKIIKKFYLFQSSNMPHWSYFFLNRAIVRDNLHPVLRTVGSTQGAETLFINLKKKTQDVYSFVARPYTGKTHQIRVHAKYVKVPILGDPFYGELDHSEIKLCCFCLEFPYAGSWLRVFIPKELSPPWVDIEWLEYYQQLWAF